MKKVLKYILSIMLLALIVGLLAPVLELNNMGEAYRNPEHWVISFIAAFVTYNVVLYFATFNPREFYYCIDVVFVTVATVLLFIAWIASLFFILGTEGLVKQILLFILSVLICLCAIYAVWHRGIAIYNKGKIRIFKFTVKTYEAKRIDDIRFDYTGRGCKITVVVCGEEHIFRLSTLSAKLCEKRLRTIPRTR